MSKIFFFLGIIFCAIFCVNIPQSYATIHGEEYLLYTQISYKDHHRKYGKYKRNQKKRYKFRSPIVVSPTKFIPFTVEVRDIGITQDDSNNEDILQVRSFSDFLDILETQYHSCETEIINLKKEYPALDEFYYQTLGKCNKDKNTQLISALYKANLKQEFEKSEHKLLVESILDKNILNAQKYDDKLITQKEYETLWESHTMELQNLTRKIFTQ